MLRIVVVFEIESVVICLYITMLELYKLYGHYDLSTCSVLDYGYS